MRSFKIVIRLGVLILFIALMTVGLTVYVSQQARSKFQVQGVDVSSYQGEIDWDVIADNDVSFVFMKATEGSSYQDKRFEENIKNANQTEIAIGVYHFMSFESSGKTQAQNFIKVIGENELDLPPVIDLELYGKYKKNPPSFAEVKSILDEMVDTLYQHFGVMPIIYTNHRAYNLYITGKYKECDIWICDVIKKPYLSDGRKWIFWQYSHFGKMDGYNGEEKYIDLNMFFGTRDEFKQYIEKNKAAIN